MEDIDSYRFLTNGNLTIPNVDDAFELSNTLSAMKGMDFSDADIDGRSNDSISNGVRKISIFSDHSKNL